MSGTTRNNEMNGMAHLMLFLTSYIPLFVLIALRSILKNRELIFSGQFDYSSINEWGSLLGLPISLIVISILSLICCSSFLLKLNKDSENGYIASIKKIDNRNNESLGYIASYILPFISTDGGDIVEIATFLFLMIVIYAVYIRSNMILINPILNIRYSLYDIEFICGNDKQREGLVIVRGHDVHEDERLKLYQIGFKIYYGKRIS